MRQKKGLFSAYFLTIMRHFLCYLMQHRAYKMLNFPLRVPYYHKLARLSIHYLLDYIEERVTLGLGH